MSLKDWAAKAVESAMMKLDHAFEVASNPKLLFQNEPETVDYLENRKNEIRANYIGDAVKEHFPHVRVYLGNPDFEPHAPEGEMWRTSVNTKIASDLPTLVHEVAHMMVQEIQKQLVEPLFPPNPLIEEILVQTYANSHQMGTLHSQTAVSAIDSAVEWLYDPEVYQYYIDKYQLPEAEQISKNEMLSLFSNPEALGLEALFNHPITLDIQAALQIEPSYDLEHQRDLRNTAIEKAFYDQMSELKRLPHTGAEQLQQTTENLKLYDLLSEKFNVDMSLHSPTSRVQLDLANKNTLVIQDIGDSNLLDKATEFLNKNHFDPSLVENFNQQALELSTGIKDASEVREPVSLDPDNWTVKP